jgi:hypothetical protein
VETLTDFGVGLWLASAIGVMIVFSIATLGYLLKPDNEKELTSAILITPVVLFLDFVVFSKSWRYFTGA